MQYHEQDWPPCMTRTKQSGLVQVPIHARLSATTQNNHNATGKAQTPGGDTAYAARRVQACRGAQFCSVQAPVAGRPT